MYKNWNTHTLLAGMQVVQPFWKVGWPVLKKLKINLPHDSAIPFLGNLPKRNENIGLHKDLYANVHVALLIRARVKNSLNVHQLIDGATQWNTSQQ